MKLNLTPNRYKTYHSPFKPEELLSRLEKILIKTKTANYWSHLSTTEDLYKGTIEGNKFNIQRAYLPGAPTIYGVILPEDTGSKIIVKIYPFFLVYVFYYLFLLAPIALLIFLYIKIPVLVLSRLVLFPLLTFIPFVISNIRLNFVFYENNFFLERWLIEDNIDQRKSNLWF